MKALSRRIGNSGPLTLISLAAIIILVLSTNPVSHIIYAVLFFGLALLFFISCGYLLVRLQTGAVSAKNKYRVVVISLVILVFLMFVGSQSLSWVDGLILALIGFGLVFYISRR
ncbi:MAG TPA: hypothetical protein VFW90_03105 [Candidatus Saccharimonadales bacterium]|nr:hypothetical protein [Candidatus Saccharimonadales bacterium]